MYKFEFPDLRAMKKSISIISFLLFSSRIFSQDCTVEMQSLKGTYTGECKKNKANGKGKAVGTDTYEGVFKSGLPEGEGVYTWNNGNRFAGGFVGGFKDGRGTMLYKRQNAKDSIVEGYWKKDVYVGKDESPYRLIYKSKLVNDFLSNSEKFADKVEQLADNILDQPFADEKYGSYLRNIEGVIEHSYYHLGQISLLRKLITQSHL